MSALLHAAVAAQARATPHAIALLEDTRTIEYAELDQRASRIAAALAAAGVAPGALVALHLERSIAQVATLLGILQCGAAVLPLPPSWPLERKREVLAFARADAVIDCEDTPVAAALHARILRIDALEHAAPAGVAPVAIDPEQPAVVLCSSGSTGAPKLIVRSHRSFFHRLEWTWRTHPFVPGERCCQKAHMTTTHALYELFEPLARGTPTVIVNDALARDLERFWDTVRAQAVSRLLLVPSMLQASLEMPRFAAPALRVLVLMGEYLHPRLAARAVIDAFAPPCALYSIYGSTEASSTLLCDLRAQYRAGEELPLGVPIADTICALVLDEAHRPVASGDSGRLHIAGPALFSAYLHDPAQTEAALVRVPGLPQRAYDTHDAVRLLADGRMQFVGRTDHVVKIRGFRVDLHEVEAILQDHPGITHAVALCEGAAGHSRLLACYAPASVAADSVFELLRARLPGYMIPSELVPHAALPLTASGKIDRRRLLQEREQAPRESPAQFATPIEQGIAQAWRKVLGHGSFGPGSSFFEVGGSSLSAFAVVQELRDAFALQRTELPGQVLYECPSIARLAARIAQLREGGAAPAPAANALVTLRSGADPAREPLILVASAGGALGSYDRLVRMLDTERAVLGLRDPWLWGARDATRGFAHWIDGYVDAIRAHQPHGPYYLCAYSSAGVFGYEIARRLDAAGERVALLALIDPVGIDLASRRRFGWWAMEARFKRAPVRLAVRLAGALRAPFVRGAHAADADPPAPDARQLAELAERTRRNDAHVRGFAQLMELNTGLPFALPAAELAAIAPGGVLDALLARVRRVTPEVDAELIERMVLQYPLQVGAQNAYRMRRYAGTVTLFEPQSQASGLVGAQLRAHVARLDVRALPLAWPPADAHPLDAAFPRRLRTHYLCMRDERFVDALARALGDMLRERLSGG